MRDPEGSVSVAWLPIWLYYTMLNVRNPFISIHAALFEV